MKNAKNNDFLPPDDPRLTAYALGELEGEEHAAIETALRDNAEARATVEAVRAMAGQMTAALVDEPAMAVEPKRAAESLHRAAIVQGRDLRKLDGGEYRGSGTLIRFPQFYYVASGLAAACFVMFVALRKTEPPLPPQKYYKEITLTPVQLPGVPPAEVLAMTPDSGGAGGVLSVSTAGQTSDGKISLLEQVRQEEVKRVAWDAPGQSFLFGDEGRRGVTLRPQGGAVGAPVGKMAVQTASSRAGANRIFEHPMDEKFVVSVRVPSSGFIVDARPKAPAQSLGDSSTPLVFGATGQRGLLDYAVAAERARHDLLSANLGMKTSTVDGFTKGRAATDISRPVVATNTEAYAYVRDNDFLAVAQNPFSTFSIDVDTASYANVRRFLRNGQRPPADAVRIEELVNYFPYHYAPPAAGGGPIAAHLEVAEAPWAPTHRLMRIALKGREVATTERAAANLVFLLDVSGSMNEPNRLPLVKESMRLLVGKLRPDDRVAIVTYAGNSGLALPSTPVAKSREILAALDALTAGGSTNGAMGIELAYDIAKANFVTGGLNRVILCTDGDFNVGVTSEGELTRLIAEKAKSGVFLTALGFGMGNLKDATLEKLADKGNGNYGYIDSRREAEKLLVEQVNGTLLAIAKDVKIQVDFNPERVASYRLIGYENRLLKKEDFNDDKVDAGEIGAGHTVTALYELVLVGAEGSEGRGLRGGDVEPSRYATTGTLNAERSTRNAEVKNAELLTVRVRYKEPAGDVSQKVEFSLTDTGTSFAAATPDFKFAAAVAGFGMILRDSPHKGSATLERVAEWATAGTVDDAGGWRGEFVELTRLARTL